MTVQSLTKTPEATRLFMEFSSGVSEFPRRAKNSLKTKGFAAWLSRKKHLLKQPKASDRREAYKELLEMKRFEAPEI